MEAALIFSVKLIVFLFVAVVSLIVFVIIFAYSETGMRFALDVYECEMVILSVLRMQKFDAKIKTDWLDFDDLKSAVYKKLEYENFFIFMFALSGLHGGETVLLEVMPIDKVKTTKTNNKNDVLACKLNDEYKPPKPPRRLPKKKKKKSSKKVYV